ncbi:TIGR02757 family protein [Helicobacter sp. 12S02232-10]|uniref:TIGR02757 family protein n=1 Tax=Helicobacter sp. 12S02232-10 TaxID=1476197 RepID=UPI000BD2008D|nr:TIGR02757 family protein [Helicobacter sp. 12S02232-10]PAF49969.1 TIGR02757 family protein [Helicobacter sp. 12S02232-10]
MIQNLKEFLDKHYALKNHPFEITEEKPDPLLVLKKYQHDELFEEIALICALLSYGNAKQIVLLLKKLDFSLLKSSVSQIQKADFPLYRFQTSKDIQNLFIAIHQIIQTKRIRDLIFQGYAQNNSVIEGIHFAMQTIYETLENFCSKTNGLNFLIGKINKNPKGSSPLKRWNMYLRWMVRKDYLDFGNWSGQIEKSKLILPLDTHTFRTCQSLKILKRKTYDLHSAILATQSLKKFDPTDPIKYDFALYRIGQQKIGIKTQILEQNPS